MQPVALFETLAQSTWKTLDRSHRRRVLFGEDAITSIILNSLASLPHSVVAEDTRIQESTKGCDFELWLGNDHSGWSRYALQAKKLTVSSSVYAKLNHKVGGRPQIDILDQYARANGAAALYCFYNHSLQPHGWNCPLPRDTEQLGCSVAPSATVRRALFGRGRRNFSWIHLQPGTMPWRCLVRCPHLAPGSSIHSDDSWSDGSSYHHAELPASLRHLRETRGQIAVQDTHDLFNPEVGLRPGWVAVVDSKGQLEG